MEKPVILFDTDMDTDCDDVGALAMLLEAHLASKATLLGIIADSVCSYAAPACEYLAGYYGVEVPIGAIYAEGYMDTPENIARFTDYRTHSKNCLQQGRAYNAFFARTINKTDRDYPSAAKVYRQLLVKAEDNSITVLCVGMLTAAAEALESGADEISPLPGVELFRRKVKKVITMGNPHSTNDFNWGKDALGAKQFFALCPVPVYISAEGGNVITGAHLSASLPHTHPLRQAYEIWLGQQNTGRPSWDLIASLYALEPDSPYLRLEALGDCQYDAEEKSLHIHSSAYGNCHDLHVSCSPVEMAQVLNSYMLGKS